MKASILFLLLVCISYTSALRARTSLHRPRGGPIRAKPLPHNPTHRPKIITLPYRPPRTRPVLQRVRRDLLTGQVSTNPNGGLDAKIQAGQGIGSPNHNLAGGVFAAGNTASGPVTTGGRLEYNLGGNQLSLTKTHTPGISDVLHQNAKVNLFNNGQNAIDANVFKSQTTLNNGFGFKKTGGSLDWSNVNGHGANIGVSRIPNFGTTYELGGKANLWQSQNKQTTLDLYGGASKTIGGPFNGRSDLGGRLSFTSFFG